MITTFQSSSSRERERERERGGEGGHKPYIDFDILNHMQLTKCGVIDSRENGIDICRNNNTTTYNEVLNNVLVDLLI